MLSQDEQALCAARTNQINYDAIPTLHYLGNYTRTLPISMARMMENAYDWEHLPYVHASSFASINIIDSGKWGWRALVGLPEASGGGTQLLDLLVDEPKGYWATTIFSGAGEGVQIHTQATSRSGHEIDIDVRFYLPEDPGKEFADFMLPYLQQQYATLYDEDEVLMAGRQTALDDKKRWLNANTSSSEHIVGALSDLSKDQTHIVETNQGRFCVRHWNGQWIAHSAVCPHLLGPLDDSKIEGDGTITCPWHDYKFDVLTGENIGTGAHNGNPCRALSPAPNLIERDGALILQGG